MYIYRCLPDGVFSSRDRLDDPASCAETCPPGFFADFERCVSHCVVTCRVGEYKLAGTANYDVMYLPCQDCHGKRLVSGCSTSADAQRAPCPPLGPHEEFADTSCSVVCSAGAQCDAAGECELCPDECLPGFYHDYAGPQLHAVRAAARAQRVRRVRRWLQLGLRARPHAARQRHSP